MPRRTARQPSRPSIRRVAIAVAVLFGVLELGVLMSQMWTSTLLRRATEEVGAPNQGGAG